MTTDSESLVSIGSVFHSDTVLGKKCDVVGARSLHVGASVVKLQVLTHLLFCKAGLVGAVFVWPIGDVCHFLDTSDREACQ